MTGPDSTDDSATVTSHLLAYLRSHGKKLDLILDTLGRHREHLGPVDRNIGDVGRDVGDLRRDVQEVKGDLLQFRLGLKHPTSNHRHPGLRVRRTSKSAIHIPFRGYGFRAHSQLSLLEPRNAGL
ncbi:MAG TPA: hypothetical protein VGC77_07795 [Rhodopseudomonas sp.]|uniref:hypothetical protein n=1 Tax=Rhodopseudomonas sp. TaxID=1078 RepID=UPI002ED97653